MLELKMLFVIPQLHNLKKKKIKKILSQLMSFSKLHHFRILVPIFTKKTVRCFFVSRLHYVPNLSNAIFELSTTKCPKYLIEVKAN